LDALAWAQGIGGLPALIARSEENSQVLTDWVAASDWADFLAVEPATRSCTSVCLKIVDPWFTGLSEADRAATSKAVASLLEAEDVAYDINAYRDAPPGLRIWTGATIEKENVAALTPWLDWAYATVKSQSQAAA